MDESIDMYSCITTFIMILAIIMWFVMHVIDETTMSFVCGFVYIPVVLFACTPECTVFILDILLE